MSGRMLFKGPMQDEELVGCYMNKTGRLIIMAAPSGAGKTSVIERFLATHPNTTHSISCTTRPPRPGEVDGEYYYHLDRKTFEDGIANDKFAEWAEVHDNLYGTPIEPLDSALRDGKNILLDLDVIGSLNLKKMYGDKAISIFILPPSMEELKKRLCGRASDSREQQELRLKNALTEITYKDKFDHQVVNDILENACREIEKIIE